MHNYEVFEVILRKNGLNAKLINITSEYLIKYIKSIEDLRKAVDLWLKIN